MEQITVATFTVRRANPVICIIDVQGDIDGVAEDALMQAYTDASAPGTRVIILNFSGLRYMNSIGIGLIVTLLIHMNHQKQFLLAYGFSEHYLHIFELTRLSEAISIFPTEAEALITA